MLIPFPSYDKVVKESDHIPAAKLLYAATLMIANTKKIPPPQAYDEIKAMALTLEPRL